MRMRMREQHLPVEIAAVAWESKTGKLKEQFDPMLIRSLIQCCLKLIRSLIQRRLKLIRIPADCCDRCAPHSWVWVRYILRKKKIKQINFWKISGFMSLWQTINMKEVYTGNACDNMRNIFTFVSVFTTNSPRSGSLAAAKMSKWHTFTEYWWENTNKADFPAVFFHICDFDICH